MFKNLRRKFIAISTLAVSIVISIIFVAFNYSHYYKIEERSEEIIEELKNRSDIITEIFSDDNYMEYKELELSIKKLTSGRYQGSFFVKLDEKNDVIKIFNKDKIIAGSEIINTDKDIIKLVKESMVKKDDTGLSNYYKFLKIQKENEKIIIFVDCERELRLFYATLTTSLFVALAAILGIVTIIVIMSNKIISPIENSYKKQKQFITDASHELKTPLAIINSNTDVLEMENGVSKWTNNIHNQVDRLTSLVDSLVIFSRMEEKEKVEKNPFYISELLRDRVISFEELAAFKGKEIIANIPENIKYEGDEQAFLQVFDILLDNAVKYALLDTNINVFLRKDRKNIIIKVSNYAKDIKSGNLKQVFDRFYRLDESRNSKVKGYGIGLSLAKVIIEKHKGSIRAFAPKENIFVIEIKLSTNISE